MSRSPFKYLDAYQKEDAASFFGRERETAQLYNAVHASNLVMVYGASGTGKSSLVNCGLGNQFVDSDWLPLFVRRGTNLKASLDRAIAGAAKSGPASDEGSVVERLRALYLDYYRPVYLIFDQFEELYILGDANEQRAFYDTVRQLLGSNVGCKLLLVLREEYIAYLSEFEKAVPPLFDNRLRIEQLNDLNLSRVIMGTTSAGRIRVVDPRNTVSAILENIRDRRTGVDLVNLQIYLDRLWREANATTGTSRDGVTFDRALVDKVGTLGTVLRDFLTDQLDVIEESLKTEMRVAKPEGIPLEVLFSLVTEEGTKRNLDVASIVEALPADRGIGAELVQFCVQEFQRLRLLRPLVVG